MNKQQNDKVWQRLLSGKPIDDLQITKQNGRFDLSEMSLPAPEVLRQIKTPMSDLVQIDSSRHLFHDLKWNDLNFTASHLRHVAFSNCSITNCVFDQCDCRNWRFWDCIVSKCSFGGADLREAVLGGVNTGSQRGCFYYDVDFSGADMRRTTYKAALFERCFFRNAWLSKIDFQGSRFVDCVFEGELDDVTFYRKSFEGEAFPPNEMINVDFTKARLKHVGFRNLSLNRVRLPHDSEHVVIKDFMTALNHMAETFGKETDPTAKTIVAVINIYRKWALPSQAQGVVNLKDLANVFGEDGVRRFIAAIPNSCINREI